MKKLFFLLFLFSASLLAQQKEIIAYFSDAALTPESREKFVNAVIDIFIRGNLPKAGTAGGPG
ncbi:MAG TPA: hypothetical protein VHO28_04235, partial [Ignavibacteriales bacterium]|nr:hypothetical protein [Ignavibacteriales bacterium]